MQMPTVSQPEEHRLPNLNYGFQFYEELAPVNLNYVAVLNGLPPQPLDNFSYCELGCGNGVTTNLLAASYPQGKFWGIDINSDHISNATRLAKHGEIDNVKFICKNFADIDLKTFPKFDYIVLNSLFGYLGPNEHNHLLDFLKAKLKAGGLLYVSYNTMPGWSNQGPIREILKSCAEVLGGSPADKLKTGLEYIKLMHDQNTGFFDENEAAKQHFQKLIQSEPDFIMRQSLSDHADAFYFKDVANFFKKIHLRFSGSLPVYLNHKTLSIPKTFIDYFDNIDDREFLESQKDIISNTSFRKDIFVNESVPLNTETKREAHLEKMYFTSLRPEAQQKEQLLIGEQSFMMKGEIYTELKKLFNKGVYNAEDLSKNPSLKGTNISQITAAIKILMAFGFITPCRTKGNNKPINKKAKLYVPLKINQDLTDRVDNKGMGIALASPTLGSAIYITRIMTYILEAYIKCDQDINKTVDLVVETLKPTLRKGADLDEFRSRLEKEVPNFQKNALPVLLRLDIIKEVKGV